MLTVEEKGNLPHVCVLMATFNGEEFILEQLESLLNQNEVRITLLISDDGSTDRTQAKVNNFIAMHHEHAMHMVVLEANDCSLGAGGNFLRLLEACDSKSFDYIALSDQDDIWLPDKLRIAIKQLEFFNADCFSSAVTAFWQSGRQQVIRQSLRKSRLDFLFEGGGHGCTYLMRSRFVRDVQSFLNSYGGMTRDFHYHDWLLYLLARTWKRRWIIDGEPQILYRQHDNNDTGTRFSTQGLMARVSKIRSGWYRGQIEKALTLHSFAADFFNHSLSDERNIRVLRAGNRAQKLFLILSMSRRSIIDRMVLAFACVFGHV